MWVAKNPEKIKEYQRVYRERLGPEYVERMRKRYLKDKEKINARSRKNDWDKKVLCFMKYGGSPPKCACCGEGEIKFLSVDHINGGGSKQKKELGGAGGKTYRWMVKNNFPPGFQILCHNCNQAKGAYGMCPHKQNHE